MKNGSSQEEMTSSLKRLFLLYKKQVPRKYNLSRSVNFFGNYKCQDKLRNIKLLYNEEFDPGSG